MKQYFLTNLFIAAVAAENADGSEQTNTETGQPFLPWIALPVDDELGAPPGTDVPNVEYHVGISIHTRLS